MRLALAVHFAFGSSAGLKFGEEMPRGIIFLLSCKVQRGRAACFPSKPPVDAQMFLQHLVGFAGHQ